MSCVYVNVPLDLGERRPSDDSEAPPPESAECSDCRRREAKHPPLKLIGLISTEMMGLMTHLKLSPTSSLSLSHPLSVVKQL